MEKEFCKLLETGKIQEVEDFENDYPMYFTDPKQLIEIFEKLELEMASIVREYLELWCDVSP